MIHSTQATLFKESDQLRLERHQGHSARSQVAHIDEVIHSAQATLPNESDKLRLHRHSATSPLGYIAIRLERHQGHSARSPAAHFDEFVYSASATLPQESDQLRLHRYSATSPFGLKATKATTPGAQLLTLTSSSPGAQLLTLTSSSTLHRPRCLRNQTSSGYIATRLHRHLDTSPFGWNATKATAPGAQQLTLTSLSTLHRPRCLRSQTSSGYIATRLHRHSA